MGQTPILRIVPPPLPEEERFRRSITPKNHDTSLLLCLAPILVVAAGIVAFLLAYG